MEWIKKNWMMLGLILVAAFYLFDAFGAGIVSYIKDKRFDRAQAEWMKERQGHIDKADKAQTSAQEKEIEATKLEAALSQLGPQADAIVEKINAEDKKMQKELDAAGVAIDPCERVRLTCARLNIKPADCECSTD